jgi:hypothetical protein
MLPLYAARIEDLGPGDFVKIDCAACHHVALLSAEVLLRGRAESRGEGAPLEGPAPVPRVREEGAGGGIGEVAGSGRLAGHP